MHGANAVLLRQLFLNWLTMQNKIKTLDRLDTCILCGKGFEYRITYFFQFEFSEQILLEISHMLSYMVCKVRPLEGQISRWEGRPMGIKAMFPVVNYTGLCPV